MGNLNFKDITVGSKVSINTPENTVSTAERIDNEKVKVMLQNKEGELLLAYKQNVNDNSVNISVLRESEFSIFINGKGVDSVDKSEFDSLIIGNLSTGGLRLKLTE